MAKLFKIDPIKLNDLISEGKSNKDIAEYFNCSPSAVSQAKRRLGCAVVCASAKRANSAADAAPLILSNDEDAMRQLSFLIGRCGDELSWIEKTITKSDTEDYRDWLDVTRKHIAEIQKLVSTIADIEFKMHHVNNVQRALLIMLEEIANESKELQARISDRFKRSRIAFLLDDRQFGQGS